MDGRWGGWWDSGDSCGRLLCLHLISGSKVTGAGWQTRRVHCRVTVLRGSRVPSGGGISDGVKFYASGHNFDGSKSTFYGSACLLAYTVMKAPTEVDGSFHSGNCYHLPRKWHNPTSMEVFYIFFFHRIDQTSMRVYFTCMETSVAVNKKTKTLWEIRKIPGNIQTIQDCGSRTTPDTTQFGISMLRLVYAAWHA